RDDLWSKSETVQYARDIGFIDGDAQQLFEPIKLECERTRRGWRRIFVVVASYGGTRAKIEDQLHSAHRRIPGEVGIEPALEPSTGITSKLDATSGVAHADHVEVRAFQQNAGGVIHNFAIDATHDAGDRQRLGSIRDQ